MKRKLSLALAVVMLLTSTFTMGAWAEPEAEVPANTVKAVSKVSSELQSYDEYSAANSGYSAADGNIVVDAVSFISSKGANIEKLDSFKGENGEIKKGVIKWTNEEGSATYKIKVPSDALYNVKFIYYAMPSRNNPVSLGLKVDGKYLFEGANTFDLPRVFTDKADENGSTVRIDGIGNEFAAEQTEVFMFQEEYFVDHTGIESSPYTLALSAGEHTLEIVSLAEPFALDAIVLCPPETYKPYAEVSAEYDSSLNATSETIKLEGEDALYKNTHSLVDQYDQSDPSVSSVSGSNPYLTRINYIGDVNWASSGQRLTWKVEAPANGYYKLAFRYKQSHVLNGTSYRKLMINGKVPFAEANEIAFDYDIDWKHMEFADDKGTPYLVYLKEGENLISMEVTLGGLTETVRELQEVTYEIGNLYRDMIKITGENPDNNRDYALFEQIPNFLENLADFRDRLNKIAAQTEELAGQTGGTNATTIRSLSEVLDNMYNNKYTAHQYKGTFYSNYTSVSALVYSMMEMGLNLDYIEVAAPEAELEDPAAGGWESFMYSVDRFLASFSADYNNVSGDLETEETITIWANWGRDQIRVLNNLIQSKFTPETGIGVNLKMSNASYVQAILSGKGPDCSLHMARSEPVNLALRDAMVDLSQFDDFDETLERFMSKNSVVPFTFDRDSTDDIPGGVYALPDTLNFYMLFYRTDIFEEYGLQPPKTWDQFLEYSSIFNRNNLQTSLPYVQITTAATVNAGVASLSIFPTLIMQMGGKLYTDDGSKTTLSTATSIKAFEFWTDFFEEYKLPLTADFFNRFRLGTMPMGVQNYTNYIQLTMAAPEITGKWKMVPIPGFENADGTINNVQAGSGTGCGILKVSKNKEAGWEFLKWWTSAETQLVYSNNCESILGVSGRVATANPEALRQMSWDKESIENLLAQWERIQEVPEVPGSYYTARSIDQAYWNVTNNSKNAKDMMIKWAEISDTEMARKREQYGVK